MFAKLCNWAALGCLVCLLGACGGDMEGPAGTSPASLNAAAAPADVNAAFAASEGAAADVPATMTYRQAGAAAAMQLGQNIPVRGADPRATAMAGGAAQIAEVIRAQRAAIPRVLRGRDTDPEVADDDDRARMAVHEAEFEKSFSLEKNRELAARRAIEGIAEPVGQQAYVPHEDCTDPRLPECAAHARMARY